MNEIVVKKNRGMKLWAKFALVTLCTLLVSTFMYESALALNLPIMHNSSTMGVKYGSWGLDKDCSWCHSNVTDNIKLVKGVIDTPIGQRSVLFDRLTTTSNDQSGILGNDVRTYSLNGSTNVCEVCHHQTTVHNYSSSKVVQAGHYDKQLCTSCHLHMQGFKPNGHNVPAYATAGVGHATNCSTATGCHANVNPSALYPTAGSAPDCRSCHAKADPTDGGNGCGSCHGAAGGNGQPSGIASPDNAGSHAVHTAISGITCVKCHNRGGTGGSADHGKGNKGANPAFVNLTSAFGWNSGNSTCATAYCHVSPYSATPVSVTTPAWGTSAGCAACHKDGGAFIVNGAPDTGSHSKHTAEPGSSCNQCHAGAVSGSFGGVNHDDGDIDVTNGYPVTARHAAVSYSGSCSTAVCHSDPYSESQVTTPVWGVTSGCAACHKGAGAFAGNGAPATGSHAKHLALIGSACNQCHDGAVSGLNGGSGHRSGTIDVINDYEGSPVAKHASGTYGGRCLSASCHASPYGAGMVASPVWGAISGCASCHNNDGAFRATFGSPSTGSHYKHMALNNAACGQCHAGAVSGLNPGNHHSNGFVNVTGGYTASPVSRHPIGTYNGTCANSCHTNGNGVQLSSPKWGVAMPANCSGCHGGSSIATPASAILATGKHRSHMNNISTLGKGNNLKCAECHAKTVSLASNLVITNSAKHINSYKDYSGVNAGGSDKYTVATGVCSTVYCHSSGQASPIYRNMTGSKAWGSTAKFDCNGCHGRDPGAQWDSGLGAPNYANHSTVSTANSHEKHVVTNGMVDSRGCAKCHRNSVDMGVANKLRNYSSVHLNRQRDVVFSIFGAYSATTKTCTTYCHSNVQAPGGNSAATVYSKPIWGSSNGTMSCASCHANISTLTETAENLQLGSHRRHAVYNNTTGGSAGAGYSCSLCHGNGYAANEVVGLTHADGQINVSFTVKGSGTTYNQASNNVAGNGYGTCSTSKCHGRATRNWGINTSVRECEKCHGSTRTAKEEGAFKDTAGSTTGSYVGTHVSHLAGTHNLTAPLQCVECHRVPASISSFDHMSSLPARIKWGVLSARSSNVRGGDKAAMTPSYNPVTKTCNNTYCHAGVQIKNPDTLEITYQGSKPNPTWNDAGYLGGTGCNMCHGYPPAGVHTTSTNCNACHNHIDQSNLSMADKSKHMNGKVETTVDECLGCHSSENVCAEGDPACVNKQLVGGHLTHTNSEMFLYNLDSNGNIIYITNPNPPYDQIKSKKKLSANDYIDTTWIYRITYKKGFPQYACGFCHPMDTATHKNGVVDLDLDPTHALRGSVKTKNKAGGPWLINYSTNRKVVCNNVYCHSSGYVSETTQQYQFKQTPDWYYARDHGGTSFWAGVDRCAECHGNSPNTGGTEGSTAHARHVVANHYKDVFDGYSGKLAPVGAPNSGAVHGDSKTSTNFNCNVCHFNTVRDAFNDKGSVCVDCHTATVKGNMKVYSGSTKHINGDVDVEFIEPFNFKSKAQLRNNISSVQSVYTSWTRVKGYKNFSSYDIARKKPQYSGGTCTTTSCHNGTLMEWRTKGPLDCSACHNGLPQ